MRREPRRSRYFLIVFSGFAFSIVTDLPDVDITARVVSSLLVTLVASELLFQFYRLRHRVDETREQLDAVDERLSRRDDNRR